MTISEKPQQKPVGAKQGQIIAIFALMLVVIIGMVGLAIDLTHVRGVAEEVQRAADAGALAGVVYLPEASTSILAETTANAAVAANGFPIGGVNTITDTPNSPLRRLKVVVSTKVTTPFLALLGKGTITVTRSAVASYADPVAMGAPDHVLGFAPFPTEAFNNINGLTGFYPQGFYLQLKGSYGGLEHGDAFSPYFESTEWSTTSCKKSGVVTPANCVDHLVAADGSQNTYKDPCTGSTGGTTYNDICKDTTASASHTMVANPYYNQENPSNGPTGYNYIFTLPPQMTHSVLLKVNDPLDECALDTNTTYSPLTSGATSTKQYEYEGTEAHSGGTSFPAGSSYKDSAGKTQNVNDWATVYGLLDGQTNSGTVLSMSTTRVDQCDTTYWDAYHPNNLLFTIYAPTARSAENGAQAPANSTVSGQDSAATVTVGYNPINAGAEYTAVQPSPQQCDTDYNFKSNGTGKTCFLIGAHAFQWLTIAKAINTSQVPAYIRVNIQTTMNSQYWSADANNKFSAYGAADSTTFATGGNVFSLGICDIGSSPDAINGTTQTDIDPGVYGDLFYNNDWEAADLSGLKPDTGCPDPNSDPTILSAGGSGTRFQVNGREAMCIITLSTIPSGKTSVTDFIPLAEIGSHFAGSDITIRLFDPGDVSSADNYLSILDPSADPSSQDYTGSLLGGGKYSSTEYTGSASGNAYPAGQSYKSYPYRLSISSPPTTSSTVGGEYSNIGVARPPWWCAQSGMSGSDYNADSPPSGDAAECPQTSQNPIDQGLHVADTTAVEPTTGSAYHNEFANDVWLEFHIKLPATYNASPGQDWWKVAYNLVNANGSADDTTTWQVVSGAAPVDLVSGQ